MRKGNSRCRALIHQRMGNNNKTRKIRMPLRWLGLVQIRPADPRLSVAVLTAQVQAANRR